MRIVILNFAKKTAVFHKAWLSGSPKVYTLINQAQTEVIMFRIGEFSKITQVSGHSLRYYNEIGLLNPANIDEWTGYRYYSTQQIPRLNHGADFYACRQSRLPWNCVPQESIAPVWQAVQDQENLSA